MPKNAVCVECGASVPLDPLGWRWYWEEHPSVAVAGQAVECDRCGADVFAFVGELALCHAAARYFAGVTH